MGHGQMLRVSKADGWLPRSQDAGPGRQDPRSSGGCVIIRSGGCLPGEYPTVAAAGRPGDEAPGQAAAAIQDCRRSDGDQPGGSGPPAGTGTLRLHLVMIPPGTRGTPHLHPGTETAGYVVSGQAEVWHGAGLARRSVVRAGDFIYIPPGTPHLAVNRGDVTSIAVMTCHHQADPGREGTCRGDRAGSVAVDLPRHLAGLLSYPVGYGG
jgi:quercetin dioxygenase-like cupin family protein